MTLAGRTILDALQIRAVARECFYPRTWTASPREALSLQRKWLAAWRRAPGCRVPIGLQRFPE
jgi:hypothetical protein